ncbi:multisynthetase complex auxiliary component p43, putative [Eimeria mitis]|uniref:Multisynthetase complex auxiliary component p43, putative n=1 Tax=Eimeria mitis TaxID=44415 RepID=U6K9N4_9EIME|nr:multisynthetase complex auxiliary component p43, putative [Eimeria mitis]CDJ32897.1 multisynthetase complex auxiliary component p43, putative [Eimeria mitis]
MELVYKIGVPAGAACALVASYGFPPGVVTLSALGSNAAKAINDAVRLYTPDGELDEPATIIRYLCTKSDAKAVLLGPEKNVDEQAAIDQWLSFCASKRYYILCSDDLNDFNATLEHNTFLCGNNLTAADLVGMASVYVAMTKSSVKELQVLKHLTRWYNHMQNLPGIKEQRVQGMTALELPTTSPDDIVQAAKAMAQSGDDSQQKQQQQKQQKQQQKQQQQQQTNGHAGTEKREHCTNDQPAAAAAAAPEKQKASPKGQQAAATAAAAAAAERPFDDPMRLDLRVGLVKKVWRHPEADKLYCEEIDFGPLGVRQIASGLVPFLQQQEFEQQKVVVLFNLKPKALRGFNSHGMVMCANAEDKSAVQLLQPPPDTPLGERVIVQGLSGEADEVLSAKKGKDTLALVSPFLKTKDDCVAYFKDLPLVTPQGAVRCSSIKGGYIS